MITDDLIRAFTGVIANRLAVYPYGDGHLVDLPWSFGDAEGMSVLVTSVGDGLYNISDRGLAASNLALAGVDLSNVKNRRSWDAVKDTLSLPGPFGRAVDQYEFAAMVEDTQLGQALHDLGAVMLRADGLRALGTPARRSKFSDRLLRSATNEGVRVVPRAPLKMKYGGERQVTAQLVGEHQVYMQGLGSGDLNTYDHARSLLSDADPSGHAVVAVVARNVQLEPWQRNALRERALVIDEPDFPDYVREHVLAA